MWYSIVASRVVLGIMITIILAVILLQLGKETLIFASLPLLLASFFDSTVSYLRFDLAKELPKNRVLAIFFSVSWCYQKNTTRGLCLYISIMSFILFFASICMHFNVY